MMIPSQGSISIFYKNLLYALMKMRIIVFFFWHKLLTLEFFEPIQGDALHVIFSTITN